MIKKIIADGLTLEYVFERKNVKNINIRVRRDGSVYVSAPFGAPFDKVEEFVLSKAQFIAAAVGNIKASADNSRIYHLGKSYTVCFTSKSGVTMTDDTLFIRSESAFDKWEKEKASVIITDACKRLYPLFINLCPEFPEIRFRKMVSKWGVCRPLQNRITFNTALVRAPMECIEYVICHEFVHFAHPDHSKRFYDTLSHILPDWKARKKLLSGYIISR